MKTLILFLITLLPYLSIAQTEFEPSSTNPYGSANPEAPSQFLEFAPMIGSCDCISTKRIDKDNWAEGENIVWEFKYTLNGMAVHDQIFRSDGNHSGNIRQFDSDSSKWYVKYYSVKSNPAFNSILRGKKIDNKIILKMDQKSPTGVDGETRMTFYDITDSGFNWIAEWASLDGNIVYPFLTIECKKNNL